MTEPSDECVERVAMLTARKTVEDHIASYGMVPHPDRIKESIAAALAKAALAALAPARDGWVLVPREPTNKMIETAAAAWRGRIVRKTAGDLPWGADDSFTETYRAMIAAAPSPGGAERE